MDADHCVLRERVVFRGGLLSKLRYRPRQADVISPATNQLGSRVHDQQVRDNGEEFW